MDKMRSYPAITAEILNQNSTEETAEFFLFNSKSNKGFSVQGLAALLCKNFDGKHTLADLISNLEKDYAIEPNTFNKEINNLIHDLESNGLVEFTDAPKT